jgi:hypothetical protein
VNTEQPVIEAQPYPVAQGHSKIGIASLVVSLGTVLLYCLVFVILIAVIGSEASTFQNQNPNEIAEQLQSGELNDIMIPVVLFVACFFGAPVVSLVALGLGVGGLFQKDKSKVFPILGTVFSGLLLCGSGGFVLLALLSAMGGQ